MKSNIKLFITIFLYFFTTQLFAAAVVTIKNGNDPKLNLNPAALGLPPINTSPVYGVNDQTPFKSVGGNFANTLGQARLNAIQYAVNKLSNKLNSNIKIDIVVLFNAFGGSDRSAILAGAAATDNVTLVNGPLFNTFYHIALAEKITGQNLNSKQTGFAAFDLVVIVNSDVDGNTVLGPTKFYYGFDQKPTTRPVVLGNGSTVIRADVDFVTTLTHELIHGIGFSTLMDASTGQINKAPSYTDVYMRNLEFHGQVNPGFMDLTNSQRISASNSNTNLHWIGPAVLAEIIKLQPSTNPGFRNGHASMYAPTTIEPGSSVSHFSTLFNTIGNPAIDPFDEMMEPFSEGADHDIGLAAQVLEDVGWGKLNYDPNITDLSIEVFNPNSNPTVGSKEIYSIVVTNTGLNAATGLIVTNFLPDKSSFVSITPATGASCDTTNVIENRIVSCVIANLPVSGTATFYVTTTINSASGNVFSANVESLNPDSVPADNSAKNQMVANMPWPPVVKSKSDELVEQGKILNFNVTATDSNGIIPIFTISGEPLNSTFKDNLNGSATFTWNTTGVVLGDYTVNFIATDGDPNSNFTDNTSVKITVKAKAIPAPVNNTDSGGCTLNNKAKFDPILPAFLLLLSAVFLVRKKKKQ